MRDDGEDRKSLPLLNLTMHTIIINYMHVIYFILFPSAKSKRSPESLAKIAEGYFRNILAHRDEADDIYFFCAAKK
jgi:predicted Ser/Thr protein kinase